MDFENEWLSSTDENTSLKKELEDLKKQISTRNRILCVIHDHVEKIFSTAKIWDSCACECVYRGKDTKTVDADGSKSSKSSSESGANKGAAAGEDESIEDKVLMLLAERDAWEQKAKDNEKRVKEVREDLLAYARLVSSEKLFDWRLLFDLWFMNQAERNLEAVKKQASSQGAEYARLMKEKESLQRQYVDIWQKFLSWNLTTKMMLILVAGWKISRWSLVMPRRSRLEPDAGVVHLNL